MFLISTTTRIVALLLGAGVLCGACSGSDRELGQFAGDAGTDPAPTLDADTGDGSSVVAPEVSVQLSCKVTPCVTALAAKGGSHVCALLEDKTVRCWGSNASGQLGVETPADDDAGAAGGGAASGPYSARPVRVANVDNATQISVSGVGTSCARLEDGSVMCWGANTRGQLALSADRVVTDTEAHPSASRVEGLPFASRVDVGGAFACAVGELGTNGNAGGSMYCWGENSVLQLGRGYLPIESGVAGAVGLRFRHVLPGTGTMRVGFAIRDNGALLSWGGAEWKDGEFGMPALKDALARETSFSPDGDPLEIPGLNQVTSVVAGAQHACAVSRGDVYCWGQNLTGAIGNSNKSDVFAPYLVTILGAGTIEDVAASNITTCARSRDGKAYCWGDNTSGQLGAGNADVVFKPVSVGGLSARVVQVAAMDRATCALIEDGSVQCWGSNAEGQLGIGARDDLPHYTPQTVVF
jgi:alpha-tubulin suppressor-like RCC1 family protein